MLEGLVAWVLNNYLGKYVENLNTDQLSIALLTGQVELENLPLRKNALRHLGLPVEIKSGFIGKVKLQIPVTQIRSTPWVIQMEKLYLVACPLPVKEWNGILEENTAQELKLSALDKLEAQWRFETDKDHSTYYASTYSSWLSYGTGFITDIIENLQLKIRDVHFRYEDCVSIPEKPLGFGVVIDSLSAQSCNEHWIPGYSHWSSSPISFKLLEMQDLAVYCTQLDEGDLFSNLNLTELAKAMSSNETQKYSKHYIISPVSAKALIKRNRSEQPLRSDSPRIVCDLQLEDVPITLVDWQYNQLVKSLLGLDDITRLRSYRRYRPPCPVSEDSRAWWLYAVSCHYCEDDSQLPGFCRPRPTWDTCLQRARENVAYVRLYARVLATPTLPLSAAEKLVKDDVEWRRSYDELKVLRELAMRTVPVPNRPSPTTTVPGRSALMSWFPDWVGWYSAPAADATSTVTTETKRLEGELLDALSQSVHNNSILRRDMVFGQFNFTLKSGKLSLCSIDNNHDSLPMLELEFKNLSLNIISKPRTSSHLVELSLGALYLRDKFTPSSLFPVIVGPPGQERSAMYTRARGASPRINVSGKAEDNSGNSAEADHLFYLAYEKQPDNIISDYRLCVRTKSLDVVYQPSVVKWLTEFICLPHQRSITHSRIEAMKTRTKNEFIKNWEQIIRGRNIARKSWELQLDITAPQIFFVEKFNDPNAAIAVIDFGRLHLRNYLDNPSVATTAPTLITKESEDDEMFMTPCSTPPVSEESDSEQSAALNTVNDTFNELALHQKIYDRYSIELTDMQILIGKLKDNWRYAHNKGTSTLHVLDRFNISLHLQRRIIHTHDPQYPSLTVCATLPKLVAHLNEHKIQAARTLVQIITATGLPSPFQSQSVVEELAAREQQEKEEEEELEEEDEDQSSIDTSVELSRLVMLQFGVDHMALEVQSRGRSVAELQVTGVRVAFTKRPVDVSITLTVHGLLLVDALQTFGPDFELLVASHKHVGMDSMSGSLRDSEPTSPTSPGSPDPNAPRGGGATSPISLSQALRNLTTSPPPTWPQTANTKATVIDAEALISVELVLFTGSEPVQVATIQFNNLDIIANQETIVELMGFTQRVFPEFSKSSQSKSTAPSYPSNIPSSCQPSASSVNGSMESLSRREEGDEGTARLGTTEITFDFHRLNVLLLRGVVKDGFIYGKKICTATMTEAKIQATVDSCIVVEGSLGGLQVLDLTPEGHIHQRIVSVGRDPLHENTHPLYMMTANSQEDDRKAFSFQVTRSLNSSGNRNDSAEVVVRMASLWYTHSPMFVAELQSCATEFMQYLAHLGRSIKSAATDMALGLVHARAEALAQSIYMNSRLSSSLYGSARSFSDIASPRKRRRSGSMEQSFSGYSSVRDTVPQTPYSPLNNDDFIIDVKLDIELDSPVLVLPRMSNSTQVFVAHLGKISMSNNANNDTMTASDDISYGRVEHYDIEVRDMNLFSLDMASRRVPGPLMSRPEILYSCDSLAKPILHDTIVHLAIDRQLPRNLLRSDSFTNILLDQDMDDNMQSSNADNTTFEDIKISGNVVSALKVSLTRNQYEQVLDTVQWLTCSPKISETNGISRNINKTVVTLTDISEEDTGVTTLKMDPHVRAKLFPVVGNPKSKSVTINNVAVKVLFEIPTFIIELIGDSPIGEQGLVDLTFRDFEFVYEKSQPFETNIQVSLRSIFMEDLLQLEDSRQRAMVRSSATTTCPTNNLTTSCSTCVSRSCPDIYTYTSHLTPDVTASLPNHTTNSASHHRVVTSRSTTTVGGSNRQGVGVSAGRVRCDSVSESVSGVSDEGGGGGSEGRVQCPCTPPPSPNRSGGRRMNLVLVSTLLVDAAAPNFQSHYKSLHRSTAIDFNSLDLVVSVESWVLVIDFFSASTSDNNSNSKSQYENQFTEDNNKNNTEIGNSETNVSVKSLTVVLVRPDRDVAKANISNVDISIKTTPISKEVEGRLGSMSLIDLTVHGQVYRERFLTSGKQALHFKYSRNLPNELNTFDSQLKLKMSSVLYVHTKRFLVEIQAFFQHFSQLQAVMLGIRAATTGQKVNDKVSRLSFILEAQSPVILLPVSSNSCDLLIVDLGQLKVSNCFKYSGDEGTISVISNNATSDKCLLDVMYLDLQNVNLHAGLRESDISKMRSKRQSSYSSNDEYFNFYSCFVRKVGQSLLTEKCHLKIQVERNLENYICHNVPDMSIHGELSTLDGTLDLSQYCLIRGLLTHNIGEDTEHIMPSVQQNTITTETNIGVWTLSSLRLDLLNVKVRLQQDSTPLACVNFIKSRLVIESFSNFSQDIDLVSQEILIRDTRFEDVDSNSRRGSNENKTVSANNGNKNVNSNSGNRNVSGNSGCDNRRFENSDSDNKKFEDCNSGRNVFTEILKPIKSGKSGNLVQVEIHSRRRQDVFKFTILLNRIRLMAVVEWWELAREFILQDIKEAPPSPNKRKSLSLERKESVPFELKLNITDSELVVIEDITQLDSNAVILKSTTVVTYKPSVLAKPLSCNVNNCEMYSCILGMEEETALSIIDPVTLNIDITHDNTLEITCHTLTIRLSYHDMRMFKRILKSLPGQNNNTNTATTDQSPSTTIAQFNNSPEILRQRNLVKLAALGFSREDCAQALARCEENLNDAALWLTQNAFTVMEKERDGGESGGLGVSTVELKADIISLCIIDDCGDVDVPLLELSVSKLNLRQSLVPVDITAIGSNSIPEGALEGVLASDYYNRVLSGWEPIIEPWHCLITWNHGLTSELNRNRLQVTVNSDSLLNANVTSTFTDLCKQVKDSWLQDMESNETKDIMNGNISTTKLSNGLTIRRRSPFVPYALKNETGCSLTFSTIISDMDAEPDVGTASKMTEVETGQTIPFAFKTRGKLRHSDSHKMRMHQLLVQIDGFEKISPISVDKVGVYFRDAAASIKHRAQEEIPRARIVFDVALEGTARKLVTIRSALILNNNLKESVDIKFESPLPNSAVTVWAPSKTFTIDSGATLSVPLVHAHSFISIKPNSADEQIYTYSPHINWGQVESQGDIQHEFRACHNHRGHIYRFCAEIKRENYPRSRHNTLSGQWLQPAHTITLLPTLLLVNLLPVELLYIIDGVRGHISAGCETPIAFVDIEAPIELSIKLENFPSSSVIVVPAACETGFTCRVKMDDSIGRKIFLTASIITHTDSKLKITISAPFWIINKTGLPLVFRQGGVSAETAGQFEEHEVARMVAPLLFSFSDPDASPTVVARVGSNVILDGNSQWCQNFHLQRGIQVRKLSVTLHDGRPDVVFVVGIEVRRGRGKYRSTSIVSVSPRFRLYNRSSYQLLFTQSCFATNISENAKPSQVHYLKAMPDCHMAFHWPRLDRDQLLCVLIADVPYCCWSGGLRIDTNDSMHVNVRDLNGCMYFLRLEVLLQGATYVIVFTEAETMPPPIRIDNYSEVSLKFAQTSCKEIVHSTARAHSSVPYAWDQPTNTQMLNVEAPGGVNHKYDLNKLGPGTQLTYENFIYIALTGTFKSSRADPLDVENQELVLDVLNGRDVVLAHKSHGQRSQLWRMSTTGQLQHEGSSPPCHPQQKRSDDNILVLDIEGPAPQPSRYTRLVLRRPDPRRQSTQTWRFTEEGRLCCVHSNMCVQAQDGFFGIRQGSSSSLACWQQWNSVVLGLPQAVCHRLTDSGVPLEQAVSKQRLRPGSGFLSVEITTDGPTKVLRIRDMKEYSNLFALPHENDWLMISRDQRPNLSLMQEEKVQIKEYQFTLKLQGLGISLIARDPPQELLFAQFSDIVSEMTMTETGKRFCISVRDIQIDNQLLDAPIPVFLYVTPQNSRSNDQSQQQLPALDVSVEMQPVLNENAVIFNHLIVRLKKLTIHLEERLLLKLFSFFRYHSTSDEDLHSVTSPSTTTSELLSSDTAATAHATRYYFGIMQLVPDQIRLSMRTAMKLAPALYGVKRRLGLTFIKFEDAAVDLEPYVRKHPFETVQVLVGSIVKHFKDELMWQAGIILGSVDFLGNPLGFVNDVTEGVSGLIYDGNVGALVKNVTHGLSNSAAKVTESLSDGLGRVTMDDEHEEMRQRIRQVGGSGRGGSSRDHLVAGFKGLGFGILGGATGIFKQVYEGSNDGVQGVFSGIGKGLLGAVTKPVVGVLDLASETARAVRDSSRSSSRIIPERCRPPRCVIGPGGLLPRYNKKHSQGQMYLYTVNDRSQVEQLVAYENLRSGSEDLRIVISNQRVRIVTSTNTPTLTVVIESHLSDLEQCIPITETEGSETRHYIEITMHVSGARAAMVYIDPVKKPRVRCDTSDLAKTVSMQINYAKRLYDERLHTLISDFTQSEE